MSLCLRGLQSTLGGSDHPTAGTSGVTERNLRPPTGGFIAVLSSVGPGWTWRRAGRRTIASCLVQAGLASAPPAARPRQPVNCGGGFEAARVGGVAGDGKRGRERPPSACAPRPSPPTCENRHLNSPPPPRPPPSPPRTPDRPPSSKPGHRPASRALVLRTRRAELTGIQPFARASSPKQPGPSCRSCPDVSA